ncbi:hypothetical protein [Methanosarcina sp.]|uniref:hypothetical protein n=1 Tax=Methanosarcina sp. TaxID=2213 RepID=UPI003C714BA1
MTIAAMMFVSERTKINVNIQKIDGFMKKIFPNSKDYQMSSISIQKQYKRISEKYKRC